MTGLVAAVVGGGCVPVARVVDVVVGFNVVLVVVGATVDTWISLLTHPGLNMVSYRIESLKVVDIQSKDGHVLTSIPKSDSRPEPMTPSMTILITEL